EPDRVEVEAEKGEDYLGRQPLNVRDPRRERGPGEHAEQDRPRRDAPRFGPGHPAALWPTRAEASCQTRHNTIDEWSRPDHSPTGPDIGVGMLNFYRDHTSDASPRPQ